MFRDEAEIDGMRAQLDPLLKQQFSAQGYKLLGISGGGFAYLFSTRDIKGTADLAAAKVWVPQGDSIAEMAFKASGVAPIPLPLADVYTALQTGLVDTAANTPATSGWASTQSSFCFRYASVPSRVVPGAASARMKKKPSSVGGKNSAPSRVHDPAASTSESPAMASVRPLWRSVQSRIRR